MKLAILKRTARRNGGLEKQTTLLKDAFIQRGIETSLISFETKAPFTFLELKQFNQKCADFLKHHSYDIVLGMDRTSCQTHLRAGNGVHAAYLNLRKKVEPWWKAASFAVNPLHRLILKLEKEGFENPSLKKLIVNSYFVRDQILQHYRVDPQKIEVIHNGVEWSSFEEPFAQTHTYSDRFRFLFVGHNFARKGLHFLLQSLARMKRFDFHLTVVGEDKNRHQFESLASSLGLQERVSFAGQQPNMIPFYQQSDAIVIPSIYDPFANVTLEALSMGLFVVSSDMNGGKEILNPESGIITPLHELEKGLLEAMRRPKTVQSASKIRDSVKHLSAETQLAKFCDVCLSSS